MTLESPAARAGRLVDGAGQKIIQRRGKPDQGQEAPIPAAIEIVAGGQQHGILPSKGKRAVEPVDQYEKGQELERIEQHIAGDNIRFE